MATSTATRAPRAKFKAAVQLGNVSIGDQTASVGIKIDRDSIEISQADEYLCGKRVTVRLICGPGAKSDERQARLVEDADYEIHATVDVKSFSATPKRISATLCFNLEDLKEIDLKPFAKKQANLFILKAQELNDDTDTDDGEDDDQED